MRKTAKQARLRIYESTSPIVKDGEGNKWGDFLFYTETEAKASESRLAARCGRATWSQLNTWLERIVRRRSKCQIKYQKVEAAIETLGKTEKPTNKDIHLMRRLATQQAILATMAQQLDLAWDALEDEINARKAATADKPPIDPAVIRRAELLSLWGV